MRKLSLVLLVALLAGFQSTFRSQQPIARLHGERRDGVVRLAWELSSWPQDLQGFIVRSRAVNENGTPVGSWTNLQDRPITPGMWTEKDLSNVEPDESRRKQLQSDFQNLLREKRIREVREQEFLATVGSNSQILSAVGREILTDFRRAQFIGLGCVDRDVRPGRDREYGLFMVRTSGRVDDQPAATVVATTFSRDDDRLKVTDLVVRERMAGTDLSWRFEEARAQRWSIFGFNVYRADAGTTSFRLISSGGVAGPRVEDGWRYFTFVDATAAREGSYTYAVAPVNVFGSEFGTRTVADYPPRAALTIAPALEQVQQTPDGNVSVSWTFDPSQQESIRGFVVERLELPQGEFAPISGLLPPGERRFSDTEEKANQAAYAYRVRVRSEAGDERTSAPVTLVFVQQQIPPRPTALAAEYVGVSGRPYIHLRWAAKPSTGGVTEGYVLFADRIRPGVLSRQASVPLIRGNEYWFDVPTLESRTYTVAIAGAARGGVIGPSIEARVFVPGKLPASPTAPSVVQEKPAGPVELRWEYPAGVELRGFRVTVDRAVKADERQLAADARSWRTEDATPGRTHAFEVVAVTREGTLSMPAGIRFTVPARRPESPR